MKRVMYAAGLALAFGIAGAAYAGVGARQQTARAELRDAQGTDVGTVTLTQTPNGVLVRAELSGLPAGTHAFHVHAVGRCEAPGFTSAGGHYDPFERRHGLLSVDGPHAGDMPNLHVPESGRLAAEVFSRVPRLEGLFDADGAAVVLHAGADDYRTDPAGDAGGRIACGVVRR